MRVFPQILEHKSQILFLPEPQRHELPFRVAASAEIKRAEPHISLNNFIQILHSILLHRYPSMRLLVLPWR